MTARRPLTSLAALAICVAPTSLSAAPADPFVGGAPSPDAKAPDASDLDAGDWGVSEQTGTATYTVPIALPPGRKGMQPELALRYASTAPLRGGVAAGWTLEVPSIELDRTSIASGNLQYNASLKAASGKLVSSGETPFSPVGATAYRLQVDDSFIRFEYIDTSTPGCGGCRGGWVAYTTDGVRHYFDEISDVDNKPYDPDRRWMLTEQIDRWGNQVKYTWTSGRQLSGITYTTNTAAGLTTPPVRIELTYINEIVCPGSTTPIGAVVEYDRPNGALAGGGRRIVGLQRLTAIKTWVRETPASSERLARTVTLGYDSAALACSQKAAPNRYLARIDQTGYDVYGFATVVPPLTFEYGRQRRAFDTADTDTFSQIPEAGDKKGASSGFVDVTGDGIRDYVTVAAGTGKCWMSVHPGLRGGGFDMTPYLPWQLPTASWQNGSSSPSANERCTFTGQITYQRNEDVPPGCVAPNKGSQIGYRFLDWDRDGLEDLVITAWRDPYFDPGEDGPLNGGVAFKDDNGGPDPEPEVPQCGDDRAPEMIGTRYVLRVHVNTGTGFEPIPWGIEYTSEVAVPPVGAEGALHTDHASAHSIPVLVDINGDGLQDIVDTDDVWNLGMASWQVSFGAHDSTGAFYIEEPTVWYVPDLNASAPWAGSASTGTNPYFLSTTVALRDTSGDGLPDLVLQHGNPRTYPFPGGSRTVAANVMVTFLNTGDGFGDEPFVMSSAGAIDTNQLNVTSANGQTVISGWQGYRRRLIDLDGDGLLDQVLMPGSTTNVQDGDTLQVSFGTGASFGPTQTYSLPGVGRRAQRLLNVTNHLWKAFTDLTDVDADGLPDLASWTTNNGMAWLTETAAPMRFLTTVRNGRGATTTFSYVPTSDRNVVSFPSTESRLPGTRWVVRQVTIDPGSSQPQMYTRYTYGNPAYGTPTGNVEDASRFLGFRTVTAETAGGARTVTTYSYEIEGAGPISVDATGRAVAAENWAWDPFESRYELLSYVTSGYQARAIAGGKSAFVHRTTSLEWTCRKDVTLANFASCTTISINPPPLVKRIAETWSPVSSPAVAYVRTAVEDGSSVALVAGDRQSVMAYQARLGVAPYAAGDYRFLPTSTEQQERVGTVWSVIGRVETGYDTAGNPYQQRKVLDTSGTLAITSSTFDALGNPITVKRPTQQASGLVTTFGYDAHKLYAATTTNELGQVAKTTMDVATGAKTRWEGPNTACGGACGEHEAWKVDGLGRVREHRIGIGATFASTLVEKMTYTDGIPTRVKKEQLVDVGGTAWVTVETEVDGLGRPRTETRPVPGKPAAVTTWNYDTGGALSRLDVPSPVVDTGAVVSYQYWRDGAGRVTTFRRPGFTTGLDIEYDGRTITRKEFTPDYSGDQVVERRDAFGNLTDVELGEIGQPATAITHYAWTGAGHLTSIVDADGETTLITTDRGGRRTQIRRDTRTWTLGYDLEDHTTSILAPRPSGPAIAAYTTTMTYDVLGRLATRTPAKRGLSDAVLANMGVGPIVYTYDTALNGKGRLATVDVRRFGGGASSYLASYTYEARGLVASEMQTVTTTDPITVTTTRTTARSYNALGLPTEVDLLDGPRFRRVYDARALVQRVERWNGTAWEALATYDRAIAGASRTRTGPAAQVRSYGYDAFGRVTSDVVKVGVPERASMTYQYFGDDNLQQVSGQTAGLSIFGSYEYDALGQLSFAQGPGARFDAFTYSPAGNVLTADSDTVTLDYTYSGADPQAVTSVTNGAAAYAAYAYDFPGNVTSRTTPEGVFTLEWDGEDRLRVSNGPNGREVYLYDHAGNRVASVATDGARVWLGEQELKFSAAGALTQRYAHVSDGGQVVARIENGSTVELQYSDMLQNLVLALGTDGTTRAAFTYGPFGDVIASTGSSEHRRQFNGKEKDARTGLHYYGARYYDDVTRRWISSDPLFRLSPDTDLTSPINQNLYAFSRNNPLRYYDPDGRLGFDNLLSGEFSFHWDGETSFDKIGAKVSGTIDVKIQYDVVNREASVDLVVKGTATAFEWRAERDVPGIGTITFTATGTIGGDGTVHIDQNGNYEVRGKVSGGVTFSVEARGCVSDLVCAAATVQLGPQFEGEASLGGDKKVKAGWVDFDLDIYEPDGSANASVSPEQAASILKRWNPALHQEIEKLRKDFEDAQENLD